MNGEDLVLPILTATLVVVVMVGFVGILLVVNNNRRVRHRAEVAELHQEQIRAVMEASREATQQTLRDIGSELHDNVGQLLAVAQFGLNNELLDPAHQTPQLLAARDALEQGFAEARRVGRDLNTQLWQQRSLEEAIRTEAERVERVARVKVDLAVTDLVPTLPTDTTIILYRIFQVVLANALEHSGASRLHIAIGTTTAGGLTLHVADNGRGFDPQHTKGNAGLVNIHQRCALIHYTARCTTAPGAGCAWDLIPDEHGA